MKKGYYITLIILLIMLIIVIAISKIQQKTIANKYKNAEWGEKIPCSSSTSVESGIASVKISLANFEKNTVKNYKAIKVICTIYDSNNNSEIGKKEVYYENVRLPYGYSNSKIIEVSLSKLFVGNNFSSTVEAYSIKE